MSAEQKPSPAVRELDLLGKASFAQAEEATVTVRVYDRSGKPVGGLPDTAFRLMVNGTMRTAAVKGNTEIGAQKVPLVLLVFPPNQQEVHALGVKQARQYFAGLGEELKWKVALLDADGTTTSYTQKREEVLAGLDTLAQKTEPFVYSNSSGGLGPFRWSGGWLDKAEYAVAQMRPYEGPKLLLAFNRSADKKVEEGRKLLSNAGPESLVYMAISAGAHIYIANVSGPGVLVPGGDASTGEMPEQMGPVPYDLQRRTQSAELQHFAYRAAVMQMTARDTLGGFANSVTELAGKMDRDVEANYSLRFALTAADRDQGAPHVEVQHVGAAQNRLTVVDVSPLGTEVERRAESQEKMAEMWRATAKPVASAEFRIAQHVDYFPVRGGMQPILPMSAEVAWLGTGPRPKSIHVAEFVQNIALDTPVLMKEVETELVGRALEWERDGRLAPGRYDWRVVVHDGKGHVLASADQRVSVGMPENADVPVSTLLVGVGCRPGASSDGLHRRKVGPTGEREERNFMVDPLRTDDCRLKPSATGTFRQGEVVRVLVRIYPAGKVGKEPPERWSAIFSVQNQLGAVETTRVGRFVVDTGGGYAAAADLPLTQTGSRSLAVKLRGPGLKRELVVSRPVVVVDDVPMR